ncbi:phage tail tip fiber protein [Yersinia enterocolitica]
MAFVAIIGAVLAGVSAGAAVVAAGIAIGYAIAAGVAVAALTYIAQSQMMKIGTGGTTYNSTSQPNQRSTSPATGIPIIYGGSQHSPDSTLQTFSKIGSIIAWNNVYNETSNKLLTVHAVSVGECAPYIKQLYFDNVAVLQSPILSEGVVPKEQILPRFRPYLDLEVRFGKENYSGSMSLPLQYGGSRWNNNFKGNGLLTIATVITKTDDSLTNGILTNQAYSLSVECKGRIISDIRTGRRYPSSNPVDQIADYLTNKQFGFGFDAENIDMESFKTMAYYCQSHDLWSNGNIDYAKTYKENLEAILSTFAGVIYESGGKIRLTVDDADLPIFHFDEEVIIGSVNVNTSSNTDYFNTIDATYTNAENAAYTQDIIRYPSDLFSNPVLQKDGVIIKRDSSYAWVMDKGQLSELANREMRKSQFITHTISFNSQVGSELNIYDVVTVSFAEMGWVNKKFRVLARLVPMAVDKAGIFSYTLVEYNDAVYSGLDPGNFPENGDSNLPNSQTVLPPSNLEVTKKGSTAGGSVVVLSWTLSPDAQVQGYRVRYKKSSSGTWIAANTVNRFTNTAEIYGLEENTLYDFGVAAYNSIGVTSPLVTVLNSVPTVSFALPPVTGLVLSNADISQYETNSTDFNIAWDSQGPNEFRRYYEVQINDKHGSYKKSYFTTNNSFSYTFETNKTDGLMREVMFKVIARGYSSNIYSDERAITVTNPQSGLINGIGFKAGFGQFFVEWQSSTYPDYEGIYIQTALDDQFSSGVSHYYTNNVFSASFDSPDFQGFIRAGQYDKFGVDGIKFTPAIPFKQSSNLPESALNDELLDWVNSNIDVDGIVEESITDAFNSRWQLAVTNNGNVAGIVLGANQTESVATFIADRFSIIGSDASQAAEKIYPFVVTGGKVYINSAVIADASIGSAQIKDLSVTNAKIGLLAVETANIKDASITNAKIIDGSIDRLKLTETISSANFVSNTSGMQINFATGVVQINGVNNGMRLSMDNKAINYVASNGIILVELGELK